MIHHQTVIFTYSSRRHIGLLSGNSGIYAVAALIFYKRGNNQVNRMCGLCLNCPERWRMYQCVIHRVTQKDAYPYFVR